MICELLFRLSAVASMLLAIAACTGLAVVESSAMAVTVRYSSLDGIDEATQLAQKAGAVDLGGEIVGAAVVGVQFDHQPAMRLLDRLGVGAGREAEDRIGLLDGHVAARGSGAAASDA